jgi:hypothetical protein
MKRLLIAVAALACFSLAARAALDTYALTYHDQVLAAQATTLERTVVDLFAPQPMDPGENTAGSFIDLTSYVGEALLVASVDLGTMTVSLGYETNALTVTNYAFTGTSDVQTATINLSTLRGTNAGLYAQAICTNSSEDTTNSATACLVVGTPRAALQTITGSAVDTVNYKGFGTVVVSIGAPVNSATNFAATVTIQHAAASTGTYVTVTNSAGSALIATASGNAAGAVTRLPYEFGKGGRYIRAVVTTTNDAAAVAVTLNSFK